MSEPLCKDYVAVTDLRATDPGAVAGAWQNRTTRPTMRGNGRLMIVAADHPARGALSVGSRPTAMNSRTDLLDRLRAALADPGVDGVLATAHILDDLLILGALEEQVVFSSMNSGGLAGATAGTADLPGRTPLDPSRRLALGVGQRAGGFDRGTIRGCGSAVCRSLCRRGILRRRRGLSRRRAPGADDD